MRLRSTAAAPAVPPRKAKKSNAPRTSFRDKGYGLRIIAPRLEAAAGVARDEKAALSRFLAPRAGPVEKQGATEQTGATAHVERSEAPRPATPSQKMRVLCPQENGTSPVHLHDQARALPAPQRQLLCLAASRLGQGELRCIEQWLDPRATPAREGLATQRAAHALLAVAVHGGPDTLAELAYGADRAGPLANHFVRQWREISDETRRTIASNTPGDNQLVETLDALAAGSVGVSRSNFFATLRYVLLALANAGAAGLDRTLRAMAGAGDVQLAIGDTQRHRATPSRLPVVHAPLALPPKRMLGLRLPYLAPAHTAPPGLYRAPPPASPPPYVVRPLSCERSSATRLGPDVPDARPASTTHLADRELAAASSLLGLTAAASNRSVP